VLPTGQRHHYSNLGLSLLGHLVGRLRGGSWAEVLAERILAPLELSSVTTEPDETAAVGYLVDAYSDHARPEPAIDLGGLAPAGQLWSTAADLATWAAFLSDPATVDPDGRVLQPSTVEEMRLPQTVSDEKSWLLGWGLGLMLVPQAAGVMHVGHGGGMPGFIAGAYGRFGGTDEPAAYGAAALGSSGTGTAISDLVHTLLTVDVTEFPAAVAPWTPGEPAPLDLRSVLGQWWSEGFEYRFTWREGSLHARRADDAPHKPPSVFERIPDRPDTLRTRAGGEAGELLHLNRDPATGVVTSMRWATYRFSRTQEGFDRSEPSHE
jgi:hypothetical protein